MGRAGAITDRFAEGATRQQVEFAKALRVLHRIITDFDPGHPTSTAISEHLNVSGQQFSNCLHAARLPARREVKALYRLAESALPEEGAADPTFVIPVSFEELLRLRELAIKPCGRCRKWHDAVVAKDIEYSLAERHRADNASDAGVPVPQRNGDRHPGLEPSPPRWDAIEEVQQFSESGLEGELLTLLGHVGTNAEPDELPSIMHTLQTSGMHEAADAVVDAAAARPVPVVLEIALKLHNSGLRDALGRLLSTAQTHGQG
jgi:hypothetical protein